MGALGTHPISPVPSCLTYHADPNPQGGSASGTIGTVVSGTQLRDELRDKLQPLSFGAAYKVLDMLVEHVLRANRTPAGPLTFVYKVNALKRGVVQLPAPIDSHTGVWDRLAKLYSDLEQARHAVTHRQGGIEAQRRAGDLRQ